MEANLLLLALLLLWEKDEVPGQTRGDHGAPELLEMSQELLEASINTKLFARELLVVLIQGNVLCLHYLLVDLETFPRLWFLAIVAAEILVHPAEAGVALVGDPVVLQSAFVCSHGHLIFFWHANDARSDDVGRPV